jgi:hypothetical protein
MLEGPPIAHLARTVLCLVPALLLAGVGPALAGEQPSVAVVGVHGDGNQTAEELEAITADIVAGFKTAGFEVIHGSDLRNRLSSARESIVDEVYLEPVRSSFDEGRILYEKAQPEQAIVALSRAEAQLEGAEEFLRDPRLTVGVQLYLGLSHISLGHEDAARMAFSEVVRMDPDRVLDTLDYPPRIVDLFDSVRTQVLAREGASVAVEVFDGTMGARVFVDGRMVGTTPAVVSGLPPGFHTILVDGGGAGRWFEELTLFEGEYRTISAGLETKGLAQGDDRDFEDSRSGVTRRLYRELAVASGADLVAVAAFDEVGDFRVGLYSGRSGTFSVNATASLAAAPGARAAFVRQLVERIALYSDSGGSIKAERVDTETIPLVAGGNPRLNFHLFGYEERVVADASADRDLSSEPDLRRKPPKAVGVVVAIVAGVLGAGGAAAAIYAGASANQEPTAGILVVTVP